MYRTLLHLPISKFARFTKPKPPPVPPNLKKSQPSQTQLKISMGSHINKKKRQDDKRMDQLIDSKIEQGMNEQEILKYFGLEPISEQQYNLASKTSKIDEFERGRRIENFQQGQTKRQTQSSDEDLYRLQQQLMLKQIMKGMKKYKGQLPLGSKYQQHLLDEEEKFAKKQRILKAIQNKVNLDDINLSESGQSLLKNKYPTSLVQSADSYKKNQLSYFKELIDEEEQQLPQSVKLIHRRIKKGQTYNQVLNRQQQQKQQRKKIRQQAIAQKKLIKAQQQRNKIQKFNNDMGTINDIVQYQDQDYVRQKALRQFTQLQSADEEVKVIDDVGEKDLQESSYFRDIILDQYDDLGQNDLIKKEQFQSSTFGMHAGKIKDLQQRLNKQGVLMDQDDFQAIDRSLLFQEKQEREEALAYQKYLLKKNKKKEMNKLMKKIHEEKLREDVDFDIDFKNRFKQVGYDPLDIEGNLERINMKNLQKQATIMPTDKRSQIHFMKTQKNIQRFLQSYFYQGFCNPNSDLSDEIDIKQIKFNEKKTLVHVFWDLKQNYNPQQMKKRRKNMEQRLQKSAGFISAKMTQLYGFRYGPEIRFYYNDIVETTEQIKVQLTKHKKDVIDYEVKNLKSKGYISDEKTEKQVRVKLQSVAKDNILNYHNRNLLLTKKYQKKDKKTGKDSVKKEKSVKKDASERLWDEIDKL